MAKESNITVLGVALVTIIGGSVWYVGHLVLGGTWPPVSEGTSFGDAGAFGDSFGFLTSLFSGLAFGGIILTILLQKNELSLQRRELASHHETAKLQNFESSFFQMLRLHNEIVNSIDLLKDGRAVATGRDCFNAFYTRLTKIYRAKQKKVADSCSDDEILKLAYKAFWKDHQTELGHYYRYLLNLIRFVDNSKFADGPYIKLARAQLSDQELLMLFYYCLSAQGSNFRKLIENYSLLDNMPLIRLLERSHEKRLNGRAFDSEAE